MRIQSDMGVWPRPFCECGHNEDWHAELYEWACVKCKCEHFREAEENEYDRY